MERYYLVGVDDYPFERECAGRFFVIEEYGFLDNEPKLVSNWTYFSEEDAKMMGVERKWKGRQSLEFDRCLYSVVRSENRSLPCNRVGSFISWAHEQGLILQGELYSNYLATCSDGCYLEVYLPLA